MILLSKCAFLGLTWGDFENGKSMLHAASSLWEVLELLCDGSCLCGHEEWRSVLE